MYTRIEFSADACLYGLSRCLFSHFQRNYEEGRESGPHSPGIVGVLWQCFFILNRSLSCAQRQFYMLFNFNFNTSH